MQNIISRLRDKGGNPLIVGGAVRDKIMGMTSKDVDIEVFGLDMGQILSALDGLKCDTVGKSFGIIKCGEFDISVPRRENKVGVGHSNFDVVLDPNMSVKEAASRRDFTMNSLAMTPEGEILDFFGGVNDIQNRIIRATSEQFVEDPLRVLRGAQFASRFNMMGESNTLSMCRKLVGEFETLSKSRLWAEWEKLFKGANPSRGLNFLKESGWIELFPEINLVGVLQDKEWHPEGDAWEHTLHVCDEARHIADRDNEDGVLLVCAALLHDVGKKVTTVQNENGRWISPKHAQEGVPIAKSWLESVGAPLDMHRTLSLVEEHMCHIGITPTDSIVRRLSNRLDVSLRMWSCIVEADHSGRPPLPKHNPVESWIEIGDRLKVADEKPKPILMGRHLIHMMKSGPAMGRILKEAFETQLENGWTTLEEAQSWLNSRQCV